MILPGRQSHDNRRPFSWLAPGSDVPSVSLHDPPAYRSSKPIPLSSTRISEKPSEEHALAHLDLVGRNFRKLTPFDVSFHFRAKDRQIHDSLFHWFPETSRSRLLRSSIAI